MMNQPSSGQRNGYSYAAFESNGAGAASKPTFLWWCAGAYTDLLKQFPTEYTKYAGLGGVMLSTFVLAALSSGYAIYSVFGDPLWTVAFALLWGAMIFNFDRFLVSTMRKYGVSKAKQWQMALPRIVLAVLIGVTIARPLELKIFEKEIDVQITRNRHEKVALNDSLLLQAEQPVKQRMVDERDRLLARKQFLEDSLSTLQQAFISEADGTGGSGKRGIEGLTRMKQAAFELAATQYKPELSDLNVQLASQDSSLAAWQTSLNAKRKAYEAELKANVGFLERNKALEDLRSAESSVWWATFMVSLLIILIEVGPILSKLIMPVGPYDMALAQRELMQMAQSDEEMAIDQELREKRSRARAEQSMVT